MSKRLPNILLDYAPAELPDRANPPLAPLTPTVRVVRWVLLTLVLMLTLFATLRCDLGNLLNH